MIDIRNPRLILADYTRAIERMAELCLAHKGIIALYQAGTIRQPGISDLDFLVGLGDNWQGTLDLEEQMDEELKYLLAGGTVLKVNRRHMANVLMIDDFHLRYVSGEKFAFRDYRSKWSELSRIFDWLPERFYTLHRMSEKSQRDPRMVFGVVSSLTISLGKLDSLRGTNSFQSFVDRVERVRETWRNNPQLDRLKQLRAEAMTAAERSLNEAAEYVVDQGWLEDPAIAPSDVLRMEIPGGPKFGFGSAATAAADRVILPQAYWHFLAAQAHLPGGYITDKLRRCFAPLPDRYFQAGWLQSGWYQVIRQRMDYCDRLAADLHRAGQTSGLLKYGWLL